jgi:hypothetical protein
VLHHLHNAEHESHWNPSIPISRRDESRHVFADKVRCRVHQKPKLGLSGRIEDSSSPRITFSNSSSGRICCPMSQYQVPGERMQNRMPVADIDWQKASDLIQAFPLRRWEAGSGCCEARSTSGQFGTPLNRSPGSCVHGNGHGGSPATGKASLTSGPSAASGERRSTATARANTCTSVAIAARAMDSLANSLGKSSLDIAQQEIQSDSDTVLPDD